MFGMKFIRARKQEGSRVLQREPERITLPPALAGKIELTDAELGAVIGGKDTTPQVISSESPLAVACCTGIHRDGILCTSGCCSF